MISRLELACSEPVWTTCCASPAAKNPAPSITYEKTAATTTNAIRTIAASSPVNASSFLNSFIILIHLNRPRNYDPAGNPAVPSG